MAQVTLELDQETIQRMNTAAEAAGMSVDGWVARMVETRTAHEWPPEVLALAGSWADAPTVEEIRSTDGVDVPRESF